MDREELDSKRGFITKNSYNIVMKKHLSRRHGFLRPNLIFFIDVFVLTNYSNVKKGIVCNESSPLIEPVCKKFGSVLINS